MGCKGVKYDTTLAVWYFKIAAGMGCLESMRLLSHALYIGSGCKSDIKESCHWAKVIILLGDEMRRNETERMFLEPYPMYTEISDEEMVIIDQKANKTANMIKN